MSSQIPPLVCHTPPPIDFNDADDDENDYVPDIPDDDGICDDMHSEADDNDFGNFATIPPRLVPELIPAKNVIAKEAEKLTSIPVSAETKGLFLPRVGNGSPASLILPKDSSTEEEDMGGSPVYEQDFDVSSFGFPSQPPEPPPEDSISLPSLHLDGDTSKSEDDDHVPTHLNPRSSSGSGIETEVDLPAAVVAWTAERKTPVIQDGGRFDDNTENDFTDFTTASNERSSAVLEIPTANDVSFELDDYAQLESTPSADSNFVSQQSRTDFATFDADFSKFDSFQASFPVTVDDPVVVRSPLDEVKSDPNVEQQSSVKVEPEPLQEDDFDDFQEFATFSEQPVASIPANVSSVHPAAVAAIGETKQSIESNPAAGKGDHDEDDDFGEFNDFKSDAATLPMDSSQSFSLENVHSLLETMFPNITLQVPASDTGQRMVSKNIPNNLLHSQLQDFDNTSAVTYQYSKSASSKTLVTALGIDSRNIMYGPKWHSSMPRFASNLSFNPLEPLKSLTTATKDTGPIANEKNANSPTVNRLSMLPTILDPVPKMAASSAVPAVQFDWNSSGLVNPLEASQAHTLLLDLEQLEVMASLKDKINVDSSSYPTAFRSTHHVANTVQLHSPTTTTVTTIPTTIKTPLLLSPPPRTLSPSSSQSPILPSYSSPPLLPITINTQTYHQLTNRHDNNAPQLHPKTDANLSVAPGTDGNRCAPLDVSTALLSSVDDHHGYVRGLLTSTSTTTTATPIDAITPMDTIITTNTTTPSISSPLLGGKCVSVGPLLSGNPDWTGIYLIGYDVAICKMHPIGEPEPTATSASDRPQSFDEYLDLSTQEMLQENTIGQPADGPKGEILDTEIAEDAGSTTADDIAVRVPIPPAAVSPLAPQEDDEDVRSLDFTANAAVSNNVQYATTLPQANQELQQSQSQPPVVGIMPLQHYSSPHQQQPISMSTSPDNVPVVRTIKLQETHIFTPSRGGTPVSRDITDRDIIVREYHDIEYSLEKTLATASSRKPSESDEFNDFQSVPVLLAVTAGPVASYARPIVGQSPTEELESHNEAPVNEMNDANASEDDDFSEFQAAIASTQQLPPAVLKPVNKPVSSLQQNRSNTSSPPLMLLSPAILLPQQASTATGNDSQHNMRHQLTTTAQINWPEPGIDPDEMARFEAAFAKPPSKTVPSLGPPDAASKVDSSQSAPKLKAETDTEEDEWTDFISSKPAAPNEASVPPPASFNLPMALTPDLTPSAGAMQEEWTDFISSTSTTSGSTSQNRLSSSQNNFNYSRHAPGGNGSKAFNSWSQPELPPPQFSSWNSNSLYYNPISSMQGRRLQQATHYQQHAPKQEQFCGRSESSLSFGSNVIHAGVSKMPTNPQHHQPHHHGYQHHPTATGARMLSQQPMHLLPELSFITPNAGGHSTNSPGAKPTTHSFLSNVISSNSFTKK